MDRLTPEELRKEQDRTLSAPPRKYSLLAKILFVLMDVVYGRKRSLGKFKVLEVIARVPYQAWEHVAYIAITHTYRDAEFARRIFDRIQENRRQQDNEQWHLLILQEWAHRKGTREGFIRHRAIPQVLAFVYYHIAWLLYVIHPAWSYRLNADFEDHAEREYMAFVADHPELGSEPFDSAFARDFGEFPSMADAVRQIGYDERLHKEESLSRIAAARFA